MASGSVRTFDTASWDLGRAVSAKGNRTVSVCIPCRNEAETIGGLVTKIERSLLGSLVDDLVVLDDRSQDGTGRVAREAGARVVHVDEVHAFFGGGSGKGNALWASLAATSSDFVVWCDGDVTTFDASWVTRLVMPLLLHDDLAIVKGCYNRPTEHGGGGRTTELVARPLLSLFFPELAALEQPLSGEYAVRRSMAEQLPFVQGWGVEIALLIDAAMRFGADSIGQVDLGTRMHRHQDLHSLSVQAAEVMATLLERTPAAAAFAREAPALLRPTGTEVALNLAERPPLASARIVVEE